ncbi:hypothetical protein AJ85_20035 [Alkalihalobacillus alcalophilus ATCC 27647 = CGMCC 1.3604]|uniref:Endonuclease n=1 Tax=Alkalihalobacillus alcalophilus ATCC 27647 = CGMCC 1.3604 TaxID=1218173 RepID=A0A094YSK4_ALKAL|nr:GIY-YIG nuclease family protein [Alkalihalobacillus alcalophilus]KGA96462.1 endonuclease [Alkalihalobacillus alcalophilus ATCC 27647 = CGMCC 1.3604]MED1560575.1 GIY-YIG nuclease family protein [Alkalihalobacillus alcalophilus]THG89017.1 hypothetical protein AJ85_20035 [Alkalihalobacillus alcalophilus ATCC 27647 = CGMCC 1.3604]
MTSHVVYVLECADGSWYTGYTNHFEKRLKRHEEGKGAKYTRGRGPFKVIHVTEYETKSEALKAEYAFKRLPRKEKERLIYREKGDFYERTDEL